MTAGPSRPPGPRPLRYLAFSRAAIIRERTYRLNVVLALTAFATKVFVLQFVWSELYRLNAADAPAGITLRAMLSYMVVGQLGLLVLRSDATQQIREKVRQGTIAIDLMRPVSFPLYLLADSLGGVLFRGFLAVPALGVSLVLTGLKPPPSAWLGIAFGLSLSLGFLVGFLINFITNLTAFWTMETFGLQFALQFAGLVLSGVVVPIWFLPAGLARVAAVLPFASVFSAPLSIYVGRVVDGELLHILGLQAGWLLALALGAWLLWRAAVRHMVVQGG